MTEQHESKEIEVPAVRGVERDQQQEGEEHSCWAWVWLVRRCCWSREKEDGPEGKSNPMLCFR